MKSNMILPSYQFGMSGVDVDRGNPTELIHKQNSKLTKNGQFVRPDGRNILIEPTSSGKWRLQYVRVYRNKTMINRTISIPPLKAPRDDMLAENKSAATKPVQGGWIEVPLNYTFLKTNDSSIRFSDILNLLVSTTTCNTFLDSYVPLLIRRRNEKDAAIAHLRRYKSRRTNILYLSPCAMPVVDGHAPGKFMQKHLFPSKSELAKCKILVGAHHMYSHIFLVVYDFCKRIASVYDSSWHYIKTHTRNNYVTMIIRELDPTRLNNWRIINNRKSTFQLDEVSCGYVTLRYINNILNGKEFANFRKLSKKSLVDFKQEVAIDILSLSEAGRKMLQILSQPIP